MLDGQAFELAPPILSTSSMGPARECQVFAPVRPLFERLGYQVEWKGGSRPYVVLSGDWRKLSQEQLEARDVVYLSFGERSLRIGEYQTPLPEAPQTYGGQLYVPIAAVRAITGATLRWDPAASVLHCDTHWGEPPPLVTIAKLLADLPTWLHRRVHVQAEFVGFEGDPSCPATSLGAPAPNAWAVRDGTGSVYCTDVMFVTEMVVSNVAYKPGQALELTGIVRLGYAGLPYLSEVRHRPG